MMQQDLFENRLAAGKALAKKLEQYSGTDSIVLAIPRGGVPVSYAIAEALHLPLDIALAKKIGHPANPELAIGAVSPDDTLIDESLHVPEAYIVKKTDALRQQLSERAARYRGQRPLPELRGKTILLVDDGIATGYTLLATLRMLRKKDPAKIVVAVPVAPLRGATAIRREADAFVCLLEPTCFPGVGAFYIDFTQVSDDEVIRLLDAGR